MTIYESYLSRWIHVDVVVVELDTAPNFRPILVVQLLVLSPINDERNGNRELAQK